MKQSMTMPTATAEEVQIQAVLGVDRQPVTPGLWNPLTLLNFIEEDDLFGARVLDIGANRGGLSLELARKGATVVAIEPVVDNSVARGLATAEELDIRWLPLRLFQAHDLGHFDIIICFGLLYHFRSPHYVLDYLSSLAPKVLYISTQTIAGDELKMVNRAKGILSERFNMGRGTRGWHMTHPMLVRMLQASGFDDVRLLTDKRYDFPAKPKGATNSAYYRAVCAKPVLNVQQLNEEYEARW